MPLPPDQIHAVNNEASEETYRLSALGQRMAAGSGIEDLMDDLGKTLAANDGSISMLGSPRSLATTHARAS